MTSYAQIFCTVADLIADAQAPGVDEARMYKAIREASDYLQKRIGWFVPVTQTLKFNGRGRALLYVPPLLSVTSLVNEDTTLTASDYILKPDGGFWANGPHTQILVDPDATNLTCWVHEDDGIEITGAWGKYSLTAGTGATVADTTQQSASQTTLKVSDGAKLSPGMALLIGSEQELVTGWGDPTESVTLVNGAIAATDDTVTVDNGALINKGEMIRIDFEQMYVKDKRNHILSVVRGWNNTGRATHADNSAVDVYRTLTVERGVNGTTAAIHANGGAISRYMIPDDVNMLCKEIATLIVNKAKSGYQGRTGNNETGVVFYNDAFPRFDIEQVERNYYIPKAGNQ